MQTRKIPFWRIFGAALLAPFTRGLAAWKALLGPLLAFAGANVLAVMASDGQLDGLAVVAFAYRAVNGERAAPKAWA